MAVWSSVIEFSAERRGEYRSRDLVAWRMSSQPGFSGASSRSTMTLDDDGNQDESNGTRLNQANWWEPGSNRAKQHSAIVEFGHLYDFSSHLLEYQSNLMWSTNGFDITSNSTLRWVERYPFEPGEPMKTGFEPDKTAFYNRRIRSFVWLFVTSSGISEQPDVINEWF
jgi:hypothetical protein